MKKKRGEDTNSYFLSVTTFTFVLLCTAVRELGKHLLERIRKGGLKDLLLIREENSFGDDPSPALEEFFWEVLQELASRQMGRYVVVVFTVLGKNLIISFFTQNKIKIFFFLWNLLPFSGREV